MKEKIVKILQWILCAFMAILALAFIPSVASIFLALFCVILMPVERVQGLWKKLHIQGAKKIGVLVILFLIAVFTTPANSNANQPPDLPDDTRQSAQPMQSTLPTKSENKYEGELTLDFSFGTRTGVYSGEVDSDGHPNGQGTFTSKNQNGEIWTYEGDWVAGHWEGHGTSTWWDGRVYTGEFTNDSETGYGTVTTNTGEKYEGTFIFGTICGEGTLYCTDGTKFVGTFTDFENATGTYYDKDGSSQEATIKGGSFSWQQTEKNESENTQQPEAQTNSENGTMQPSESNTESEAQPEEPANPNPLMALTIEEHPVMNGVKTKRIGTWASVKTTKESIRRIPDEQFYNNLTELLTKIEDKNYNWFNIFFEDGTGLYCYTSASFIDYGPLDQTEGGSIPFSGCHIFQYNFDDNVYQEQT